jgi:3alpha(or 20beta)-hydroxysteroid dehydrogenase
VDDLRSKTIVVTGAARGQGEAEALMLAEAGADVVAVDVLEAEGRALARRATGAPGSVPFRMLDVSSPDDWRALAASLAGEGRVVHGLVNNAGIAHRARLHEVTLEGWNRTLAVNLTGPMLGIQACVPLMTAGGSIVNVGSVAALTALTSVAYTASKWALRGLTRVAALEYGSLGIRTNAVHPGYIETPILADANPAFLQASGRADARRAVGHARGGRRRRRVPALGSRRVRQRRRDLDRRGLRGSRRGEADRGRARLRYLTSAPPSIT